jgi:hypothetical protein
MPAKIPFLYTDGTGTFTIDGRRSQGHSQFTLTLNDDIGPAYGDDNMIYDFTIGDPSIALGHDDAVRRRRPRPVQQAGLRHRDAERRPTAPLKRLPALGSYAFYLKARDAPARSTATSSS